MLTVFCSICLCVSFVIVALAIANFIVYLCRKSVSVDKSSLSKRRFLTPFHLLVLGVFAAATVVYFPVHATILQSDDIFTQAIKTLLLSAQNALQLFVLNANFDNVREVINTANGLPPTLAGVYTVYTSIYFVVAPVFTTAFALSFVRGLYENWRYQIRKRPQKIYIFSELNENSLTLAKDILTNFKNQDEDIKDAKSADTKVRVKRVVVFANVTQKLTEEKGDLVSAARDLGAIFLSRDITDIYLKDPKKQQIYRKLYLISQNENENTSKALQLIAHCQQKYNFDTTHIYVFANSDESGILIDSVISNLTKKKVKVKEVIDGVETEKETEVDVPFYVKVRRVNEKRNLIWNTLSQSEKELNISSDEGTESKKKTNETVPAIFSLARKEGETKIIDVLIVGLGQYGTELLKTVCWYCQMPGYSLRVHVFDKLAKCKEAVRSFAPDLVRKNSELGQLPEKGEAHYVIKFCDDAIDVREASFADKIKEVASGITIAFVTLGDDQMNIDTAIKLRRIFGKSLASNKGYKVPPILTVVYDSEKAESLNHGKLLKNDSGEDDYNIRFIGDLKSSYSLRNVEQADLENAGLACHMHWAAVNQKPKEGKPIPTEQELQKDWHQNVEKYNTYEYCRRSSMAQIMHLKAREQLPLVCDRKTLMENEHKRWNAFMRADGYTRSPEVDGVRLPKDTVAKIHPDLVEFGILKPQTQEKDDMPEYSVLLKDFEIKSERFADVAQTKQKSKKE